MPLFEKKPKRLPKRFGKPKGKDGREPTGQRFYLMKFDPPPSPSPDYVGSSLPEGA